MLDAMIQCGRDHFSCVTLKGQVDWVSIHVHDLFGSILPTGLVHITHTKICMVLQGHAQVW
jgi:hypothetical protein